MSSEPDDLQRLERAVDKLPRKTRHVFLAHRLDKLTYDEIAERTGLSRKQIIRHMTKALILIDRALDDQRPRCWWWPF